MEATLQQTSAPRNHVRPTLVYLGAFLAAVALDQPWPLLIDGDGPGAIQSTLGVLALAGGTALAGWCLLIFQGLGTGIMPDRPATHLVTVGPYARSRHPMFVGFTAMYVGSALLLNMTWPLLVLPAVIVLLNVTVVRCEEGYMRRTFGQAYERYCARVPRWL
jgi:protein-S-isoprenylcysteine O-methyltransferase Ste14